MTEPGSTSPHRISMGPADAWSRWRDRAKIGDGASHLRCLSHGTGFVAEVWDDVARELASGHAVVVRSTTAAIVTATEPHPDRCHFLDFAEDVFCTVIEAFGLSNTYGIGHSAGATDLLLAAKLNPACFARLFVMEPTVMDPRATRTDGRLERRASRSVPTCTA